MNRHKKNYILGIKYVFYQKALYFGELVILKEGRGGGGGL